MPPAPEPALAGLPLRDFLATLPEIVLCVTGLILLLEEMLAPRKIPLIGGTALLGCAAAFAALWALPVIGPLDLAAPPAARLVMFGGFVADTFSVRLRALVILATIIVILMSLQYVHRFRNPGEFLALVMFGALAASLVCGAADLVMIYLSVEFLSITSYVLAGYLKFQPR